MTTERQKLTAAVDEFSAAMKRRLFEKQRYGWRGWREGEWQEEIGERMISNAVYADKNRDLESFIDAANLAMMRWNYETVQQKEVTKP